MRLESRILTALRGRGKMTARELVNQIVLDGYSPPSETVFFVQVYQIAQKMTKNGTIRNPERGCFEEQHEALVTGGTA